MYLDLAKLPSQTKAPWKALTPWRDRRDAPRLPLRLSRCSDLHPAQRPQHVQPLTTFPSRLILQTAVLCAFLLAGFRVALADNLSGHARPEAVALRASEIESLAANDSNSFVLSLGDRLKIAFFETLEADRDAAHGISHVERVELSGEYTLQQDGNMFLPLLGSTPAAGMSLKQMQSQLGLAYRGMFGRAAAVSVLLVDREPVYVIGPVLRPGTFRFAPGMTVLHAVAMSGGLDIGTAEVSQFLELVRERERMQRAVERIKILLARSAVLKAERAGATPEAPPRLIELAGEAHAAQLLNELASMRKLAADSLKAQIGSLEASMEAGKKELRLLHTRVDHLRSNIANRLERLNVLRQLHERGNSGGIQVNQAQSDLDDVQERMQDALAAITRTEQRIAQTMQEKVKIVTDAQIDLERDLHVTAIEIAQEEVTLSMGRNVVSALTRTSSSPPVSKSKVSFDIVRRTSSGVEELSATETSVLQPGDLVRVSGKDTSSHMARDASTGVVSAAR
jgi:protein involved in polysaccharide export with SLBB domain